MKNKYTILLITLCLICGYTYILDVNYKNTNDNFYIEASKVDINIKLIEDENTKNLININTADKDTLKSLPGIGDSLAQNIIDYRNVSLFNDISEIKNVNRIGDKIYEKIKNLITVN